MKKIIIGICAVAFAIAANAAAANWGAVASNVYDGKGTSAAKISATAYFFDATIIDQAGLFAKFAKGDDITGVTGLAATGTIANGLMSGANGTFSYGEQGGGNYSFYFAILSSDGKSIFLSKTVTASANTSATAKSVGFGTQSPSSQALPTTGFVGVGQWASNVPEPTSGLLVMLGVGLMALRRRRA